MKLFKRLISTMLIITISISSTCFINKSRAEAQEPYGVGSTVYFGAYFQNWLTGDDEKYAQSLTYNDSDVAQIDDGRWVARYKHYDDDYYMSEPTEWIILRNEANALLLMSKKALTFRNPSVSPAQETDQWATNNNRAWLNDGFLTYGFNANERADILESQVSTYYMSYDDWLTKRTGGYICGADEGGELQTTTDKVFLLDKYEFQELVSQNDKIAYGTQWGNKKVEPVDWYLRGPATWVYGNLVNIYVTNTGVVDENRRLRMSSGAKGLRPVIRVKKDSKYLSTTKPIINLRKGSNIQKQYSLKTEVTGKYNDGGVEKIISDTELYDDNYFLTRNSSKENENLAALSMLASATAYKKSFAEDLIKKCGFREHHKYNSAKSNVWNANKVSFEVAYKKVHNNYIVAVWVKGSSNIFKHPEDWISNAHLGLGKILFKNAHKGFVESEKYMNKKINAYLKNNVKLNKSGKVKIWITGHSRGAAVANLYAKRMNKKIGKSNVFAYTFASPKVLNDKIKNKKKYSNIFNYVNQNDLVPTLPPGYKRYGIDKNLKVTKKNKKTTYKEMKTIFKKLTGKKYKHKSVKHTHCQTAYLAWLKSK